MFNNTYLTSSTIRTIFSYVLKQGLNVNLNLLFFTIFDFEEKVETINGGLKFQEKNTRKLVIGEEEEGMWKKFEEDK